MALGATIYKVSLSISDLDRHFYHDFDLTVARHPSETEERMMMRLAAFALHADERLTFTKGIVQEDEPDLRNTDYDGTIRLWIDLGQPDEKRIRKACGRADEVIIYTYSRRAADAWWRQNGSKLARFGNLKVIQLDAQGDAETFAERSMQLQALIQDGELLLTDERDRQLKITRESWA
ncbi:YaeQ family protein [Sulfurimonas sp. HSL-1656]|uniref:YaeQ family protein n=1 Tax=Thiomicrolovo subterrani TaxID=3131934 RepID=UPI0031F8D7DF